MLSKTRVFIETYDLDVPFYESFDEDLRQKVRSNRVRFYEGSWEGGCIILKEIRL